MKPAKTRRPLARAALIALILVVFCTAAAAIYYFRQKPQTVRLGEYPIPKFSDTETDQSDGVRPEPGSLAMWNGQVVSVTSTGSQISVNSVIDDNNLAVIPARVLRGIPAARTIVDGSKLYLLFFDETRGWCIAVCEESTAPNIIAILPGNTFTWQGKWVTFPGWQNTIAWGLSDFQLTDDGSLEGVVGVTRYKQDELYKDPEEEFAAYFWFHYKNGQVKFSELGEYMGPLDFQITPSSQGSASAFMYCSSEKLFYREVRYDDADNIVLSPELSLDLHLPSSGNVQNFVIVPPPQGEPDELRVLMNMYSYLGYSSFSHEPRFGDYAWILFVIDRTSFTEKSRKLIFGCGGFNIYPPQRYPNVLMRQGNWLMLNGYESEGQKEYVLAINLSGHIGYPLRIKSNDDLLSLGFCQYPGNKLAFGYLVGWGLDDSAEEKIILYELILPGSA